MLGWPTQPWDPNSDGVAGSVEIEANGAGANSPDDCLNSYENSSPNEVVDTDSDGVPDDQDAFPTDPSSSMDTDGDGYPDAWNSNATEQQIADSSLVLDAFPNDPTEYFDSDGDGVGDSQDPDPQNPYEFLSQIAPALYGEDQYDQFGVQIATNQDGTYLAVNANIAEKVYVFRFDPTVGSFMPLGLPSKYLALLFLRFLPTEKGWSLGICRRITKRGFYIPMSFQSRCNSGIKLHHLWFNRLIQPLAFKRNLATRQSRMMGHNCW